NANILESILGPASKWTQGFVRGTAISTPFNRIQTTWHHAATTAFEVTSKTAFCWSEDGQVVTMLRDHKDPQCIPMGDYILVVKRAIAFLTDRCSALLPPAITQ